MFNICHHNDHVHFVPNIDNQNSKETLAEFNGVMGLRIMV